MNFCSNCGSKEIKFLIPDGDERERFVCDQCETIFYDNPRVIVGCIIENPEGKIMLCRRGIEPRKGFWNLPCGFLENDEKIEEGAKREVKEETGSEVSLEHLHIVYNLPKAKQVYLIFKAKMQSDYFHLTPESTEIKFFRFSEIPWDEIAFSSNTFAIKHLNALRENPDLNRLSIGSYPN
jgi:ADP-ribose pyrophosphatase YjhB (NUDIX family)